MRCETMFPAMLIEIIWILVLTVVIAAVYPMTRRTVSPIWRILGWIAIVLNSICLLQHTAALTALIA